MKCLKTKGVDIKRELVEFNNALLQADLIVGHNISFDRSMVMVECYRHKIMNKFTLPGKKRSEFCTMKNGVNLCELKRYNSRGEPYYKYPKLMELYKQLFGDIPNGLHNSMVDVLACLRCYGKMKLNVDLLEQSSSLRMLNNMYS